MSSPRRSPLSPQLDDPRFCTLDVRQHMLAHVPFFASLTPEEISDVERRCRVEDFDTGESVHLIGQPAQHLYVVASGTAKVVRGTLDGTEVLLDVLRPGDFFGTLPLLGSGTYTDSVWALTPLCVLSLDAQSFDAILDAHPSVARAGLGVMAGRLERAQSHIHVISAATSEQRVAAALVMLADRTGTPRKEGLLLDIPLSRDDLASLTGVTSETVSRVLAQLRRDGVVDTGRRWVAVTDLARLRELATI